MKHFDGSARAPWPSNAELMIGAYVEFLAMALFVYFGCGAASSNAHFNNGEWDSASVTIISLQFGLLITVLAFATAHTSGGHINCAVTLGLTIVGTCHPIRGLVYLVAQLLGSVVGAALLKATTLDSSSFDDAIVLDRTGGVGANGFQNLAVGVGNAFLVEVMGTLLLVFVVLETAVNTHSVTTDGATMIRGNKLTMAPLPIGLAVFAAHVVCVPITGCSINPTRSFGPSLIANSWDNHWVWWVAPCTGAVIASLMWLLLKKLDPATSALKLSQTSPAAGKGGATPGKLMRQPTGCMGVTYSDVTDFGK